MSDKQAGAGSIQQQAGTNTKEQLQLNNSKNVMIQSSRFVSVIEGTKDLSISEEKHRSPKHNNNQSAAGQQQAAASSSHQAKQAFSESPP